MKEKRPAIIGDGTEMLFDYRDVPEKTKKLIKFLKELFKHGQQGIH